MRGRDYERVEKVNGGQNGRSSTVSLSPIFDSLPEYKREREMMMNMMMMTTPEPDTFFAWMPKRRSICIAFLSKPRAILGNSALALGEILFLDLQTRD